MPSSITVEICVESVEDAVAAELGGADRLEFCADLAVEGITPTVELMKAMRRLVQLPIHVIIRPRAGDFVYSTQEIESMERDIGDAKRAGMDGIALGLLDREQCIDIERTRRLVELARPLSSTFHHAFDVSRDLRESMEASLERIAETGIDRILTSGGKPSVVEGLGELGRLVKAAGTRIVIMAGGGINAGNVAEIVRETRAREIHTSLRLQPRAPRGDGQVPLEQRVRDLKRALIEAYI